MGPVEDLRDLIRLLEERPEWRAELRRLLLTEELLSLPQVVRELVEAQRRTDAQVAALAEAQARTEERVGRLEAAVERLAEAQRRTEERVAELAEAQRRTEEQIAELQLRVGHLSNLLGADIEADAEDILLEVLHGKGFEVGEPIVLDVDGDVDVALPAVDPTGRRLWAVVEARVRVRRGEVLHWVRRVRDPAFRARLEEKGVGRPYLPYLFGIRVYVEAVAVAREHGIGLLNVRGERVAPVESA